MAVTAICNYQFLLRSQGFCSNGKINGEKSLNGHDCDHPTGATSIPINEKSKTKENIAKL